MYEFDEMIIHYRTADTEHDKRMAEVSLAAYLDTMLADGWEIHFTPPNRKAKQPIAVTDKLSGAINKWPIKPTDLKLLKKIIKAVDANTPISDGTLSEREWSAARWLEVHGYIEISAPIMLTGPDNYYCQLIPTQAGRAVLK